MTTEQSADDTLLNDVFSSGRDRGADTAAPAEPEAKAEPTAETPSKETPEPEVKPEATDTEPKGYRDPSTGRFVPLKELTTEREKRQSAERSRDEEARLRKDADDNWRRTQAIVEDLQRRLPAVQTPQAEKPQRPDPWVDPEGAMAWDRQQFNNELFNTRVAISREMMMSKPDFLEVEALFFRTLQQNPHLQAQLKAHPMPAQFAYEQGRSLKALQEIGDDPTAFRKRMEEEIRAKVLEELKTGNRAVMPGQTPQAQPQFPGSLVDATGTGAGAAQPISDDAVLGSVFATGRKRK